MDINGSVNVNSQSVTALRNDPLSFDAKHQAVHLQQQTQSVDEVTTEQPVQQAKVVSKDMINARVSEYQAQASTYHVSADEAVGSLVDVRV